MYSSVKLQHWVPSCIESICKTCACQLSQSNFTITGGKSHMAVVGYISEVVDGAPGSRITLWPSHDILCSTSEDGLHSALQEHQHNQDPGCWERNFGGPLSCLLSKYKFQVSRPTVLVNSGSFWGFFCTSGKNVAQKNLQQELTNLCRWYCSNSFRLLAG